MIIAREVAAMRLPAHDPRHRRAFVPLLAALVLLAWLALWAWGRSPYGRYLEHTDWTASGPVALLCSVVPAGPVLVPALLHGMAWVLMTAAMMLPTTLPLFKAFDRLASGRPDHGQLMALLGLGYVMVWLVFGLLVHAVQAGLMALTARLPALAWNSWLIGAAVIAGAGAFQFSALKHRCLEMCRTPLSFVIPHWRGSAQSRHAFALGAHHGLFCVGCCWALMLLMFAVGSGNLGWMFALAAVMAIEKNLAWGRRLSAPLGIALLAWSATIVVAQA